MPLLPQMPLGLLQQGDFPSCVIGMRVSALRRRSLVATKQKQCHESWRVHPCLVPHTPCLLFQQATEWVRTPLGMGCTSCTAYARSTTHRWEANRRRGLCGHVSPFSLMCTHALTHVRARTRTQRKAPLGARDACHKHLITSNFIGPNRLCPTACCCSACQRHAAGLKTSGPAAATHRHTTPCGALAVLGLCMRPALYRAPVSRPIRCAACARPRAPSAVPPPPRTCTYTGCARTHTHRSWP
jgi:hypothetical protein